MKILGSIELEGRLIHLVEGLEGEVDEPEKIEYADDGYSVQVRNGFCVRCREVDEFLDRMLSEGDDVQKSVAANVPRWFAVLVRGREYSDEVRRVMLMNWNLKYSWSAFKLSGFYPDADVAPDGEKFYGQREDGIALPRRGLNMERMYVSLIENFPGWFNAQVRDLRIAAKDSGLSIDELYRSRFIQ